MVKFMILFVAGYLAPVLAMADEAVQLAIPGFHAGADSVQAGSDWWGLFRQDGGFVLQPTPVTVEAVRNPLFDGENEKTAVLIGIAQASRPAFLFRGLGGVQAGPLESCAVDREASQLYPGQDVELRLGKRKLDERVRLVVTGSVELPSGTAYPSVAAYQLHLIKGFGSIVSQTIAEIPGVSRGSWPGLVWAGDLDGDGELDLLLDLREDDLTTELALYLSSAAKEGELVGLAAKWRATSNC
ncbi:MAG: hypothetical protein KF886_25295 [Candidatus Hydrogenedentes bacterium]|nr:hypothetical protein [Candidatus Hydrogenedentota bacterium]